MCIEEYARVCARDCSLLLKMEGSCYEAESEGNKIYKYEIIVVLHPRSPCHLA
jgi:hypothetical protein